MLLATVSLAWTNLNGRTPIIHQQQMQRRWRVTVHRITPGSAMMKSSRQNPLAERGLTLVEMLLATGIGVIMITIMVALTAYAEKVLP